MKIVCTLAPAFFEGMQSPWPEDWEFVMVPLQDDALARELETADCWFASSLQPLTAERLAPGKRLRLVQTLGVGFDKVDADYTRAHGIYVCNGRGTNGQSVAELAVGLMLAGLRHIPYFDRRVWEGKFRESIRGNDGRNQLELGARRVGLLGLGENGSATARLLKGFGCELHYYKRTRDPALEQSLGIGYLPFDELLSSCNLISIHMPASPQTIGMIGAREFALMQPDTLLINVARGEIVDTNALVDALRNNRIFGAALDTTYPEPPPEDHPLLQLPAEVRERLIITPHIAGLTEQSKSRMLQNVLRNLHCIANGERPHNIVNGL